MYVLYKKNIMEKAINEVPIYLTVFLLFLNYLNSYPPQYVRICVGPYKSIVCWCVKIISYLRTPFVSYP